VHVHGYKATVFCTIARRKHRFAMVKTEHGLPEPMAGSRTRAWRDRLYRRVEAIAARTAGASVCYVTRDLRDYHRRSHAGLRAVVIPNGVERMDRSGFPRPPELAQGRFNLVVAGRLDLVKGHHVAIEALATDGLPPDAHLCIVGDGPRAGELIALARSSGVEQRVHVIGFRRNVYDYIAHGDALLMPSLHEGLPYTLLEAMALGVPIIASRVGGLAEVLEHEVTALLVEPQVPAALAAAIRRLRDDPTLAARIGERAQQLQRARYSLEAMTSSYLEVYREAAPWA
jgi:L-malate glycosyltransferase